MKLTAVQVLKIFELANHFIENKVTKLPRGSYQIDVTLDYTTTESGRNLPNVINLVIDADSEVEEGEYDWFMDAMSRKLMEREEEQRKYQERKKLIASLTPEQRELLGV